jgi:hypothetical protein
MHKLCLLFAIALILFGCNRDQENPPKPALPDPQGYRAVYYMPSGYPHDTGEAYVQLPFIGEEDEDLLFGIGISIGLTEDQKKATSFTYWLNDLKSTKGLMYELRFDIPGVANHFSPSSGLMVSPMPTAEHYTKGISILTFSGKNQSLGDGATYHHERSILGNNFKDIYCGKCSQTAKADGRKTEFEICIQGQNGIVAFSEDGKWFVATGERYVSE